MKDIDSQNLGEDGYLSLDDSQSLQEDGYLSLGSQSLGENGYPTPPLSEKLVNFLENKTISLLVKNLTLI